MSETFTPEQMRKMAEVMQVCRDTYAVLDEDDEIRVIQMLRYAADALPPTGEASDGSAPQPGEKDKTAEWSVDNCHTLATREIRRIQSYGDNWRDHAGLIAEIKHWLATDIGEAGGTVNDAAHLLRRCLAFVQAVTPPAHGAAGARLRIAADNLRSIQKEHANTTLTPFDSAEMRAAADMLDDYNRAWSKVLAILEAENNGER